MRGEKSEYPEKTPGDELQKMPHTTARRFKPQARLEPSQYHWWQARKTDMLIVTPRVATHVAGTLSNQQMTTILCYPVRRLASGDQCQDWSAR